MGVDIHELEVPNQLDFEPINSEIIKVIPTLKAKDIFKLIEVHEMAMSFLNEQGQGDI